MHLQLGNGFKLQQGSRPIDIGFWGSQADGAFPEGSQSRQEADVFKSYSIASHVLWWGGLTALVSDVIFLGAYVNSDNQRSAVTQGVGGGLLIGALAMDLISYYLDRSALSHLSHAIQYYNEDLADNACNQKSPRVDGIGLVAPTEGGALLMAKGSF